MRTKRLALLVLTLAVAATAAAQTPPITSEFQVNTYTTGGQYGYSAQLDRDGGFVLTWDSDGEDLSTWTAVARVFDEAQTPLTGDLQVNTFTTGTQEYTRASMDGSGRFVVVWTSESQDGSSYGIFARRFDRDGTPLSAEIPVNTFTTDDQLNAHVASDPAGNFVVTWSSYGQDGDGDTVVARRFDRTGAPVGGEFIVNTYTTASQYADAVAVDGAGNFVIVWSGSGNGSYGIFARRYDASGNALGDQFKVSTTSDYDYFADAKSDRAGNFMVVWHGAPTGTGQKDILARRFDAAGNALGDEFVVNQSTGGEQLYPSLATDNAGNFIVTWQGPDDDSSGVYARRYDRFGNAVTGEFPLNQTTELSQSSGGVGANSAGDFVSVWSSQGIDGDASAALATRSGLAAYGGAQVDVVSAENAPAVSDLNGVLESGETVVVEPTWTNRTAGGLAVTGTATDFSGPAGPSYDINIGTANYGTIPASSSANCYDATGACYVVTVSNSGARPAQHWDAQLQEKIDQGVPKTWSLHVGDSFPDMPRNVFYPFVENLFHNGITGGCAGGGYCPASDVTRAQMAVFLLKSKYSSDYVPPPATGTVFADVPASNGFAPWIENLAALGITGGCGGGNYCPDSPVTRGQMAVFLLKTKEGSSYDPPDCAGVFADVPCTPGTGFSDFIEELYSRQITGGCSTNPLNYCPTASNLRQQMAVFLVKTFGLKLYGP